MNSTNPTVDFYFDKATAWQQEIIQLRAIALSTGLTEVLKWGCPCYSLDNANVVLIHTFKDYCAFLFFKGALLNDDKGILIQQTANVQASRQIRFTSLKEITSQQKTLKAYIFQAIEVEKAGLKVVLKEVAEYKVPAEFQAALDKKPALQKAFDALTPGRQRAYLLYFAQARQAKTRETRIEKCTPDILNGKGLND